MACRGAQLHHPGPASGVPDTRLRRRRPKEYLFAPRPPRFGAGDYSLAPGGSEKLLFDYLLTIF